MEEKEIAKKGSTIVTDDKETKHKKTKIWIIVVIAIALLAILVSVLVVVAQNNAEAKRKKEERLEAEFLFAKDAYTFRTEKLSPTAPMVLRLWESR